MELRSEPDYIEKPVIDIYIRFGDAPDADMQWTINDVPESLFAADTKTLSFEIPETGETVQIELSNCVWSTVRRRIDRIPVKKNGGVPATSPSQPEGGMVGDESAL